ncbi:TIGR03757 family integrating conjugative element protein [Paraburkholderia sp. Ac-20342]|uniref:TIGR03757 family integrating conjugative element protein n=1 Tax=Paraburkholderia sp. Ac-20342 TaxID=2703889 RepID=UPI00197F6A06|nr:TIGR03757 family integrating conjugative element protein [Paraburkholderia sp. Ac-20342]MBN3849440.1 TIGR03757 family integrating conjugative element protein [Paraburkholderia sp. Ac-20342]
MHRFVFLFFALLAFDSSPVLAADIHVFSDRTHPIHSIPAGVQVVELDAAQQMDDQLTRGLPAHAEQAALLVRRRLEQGGTALQQRFASAYQGVTEAWGLGITKVPAVVVDHRYVIYGEPDVQRALSKIARFRKELP